MNKRKESCCFSLCYLNVDPRPQQMTHFLQDLLLQSIPGHSAVHVQYKRESKPKKTEERSFLQPQKQNVQITVLIYIWLLPLSLMATACSVTHKKDHFLRSQVFVWRRGQRSHGPLHERRRPADLRPVLQVVVIQVCQKTPCQPNRVFN